MKGRTFSPDAYRYGQNTQEKDNEIFEGAYTAEYWEYDSRLGRRWNTDPDVRPWESSYACFAGNPVFYSDINGDTPGDPPVTAYHNTTAEAGEKIIKEGFKAGKSGWNFFMTKSDATKAGKGVKDMPVQLQTTINTEGAKVIKYKQWSNFYDEAKVELGLENVENGKMTIDQIKAANAIRNQKAANYMIESGGDAFVIEAEAGANGQKFIALTNSAVETRVNIAGVTKGEAELLTQMEKISAKTPNAFSKVSVGSKLFRYGRTALRITGEALIIEGVIYTIEEQHRINKAYVKMKKAEGKNWMTDTYSDVGIGYWLGWFD